MTMRPILELENFEYYYGSIHAIKGISMHVNAGEIVTLIGANGAGKSTILRSISGLNDPRGAHGKVIFDGKDITKLPGHQITALGITQAIEGRQIFSQLTVEENLMMGAYQRKDSAQEIKNDMQQMFDLFPRLLERRKQLGGTLSGGEQQMLAIARAWMGKPKLLLLDEPSLGVAPLITKDIFEKIVEINERGMTILLVEQNAKIALKTAARGYVMQTGKIILEDACEALKDNDEVRKTYLGQG